MAKRARPVFNVPSEAMRAWSQALRSEVEDWPQVTLKNAFGMTMAYRGGVVFAALPGTRALYVEDGILLKFMSELPALRRRIEADTRFAAGTMQEQGARKPKSAGEGRKWRIFLMRTDADVHGAMEWLAEAYETARKRRG